MDAMETPHLESAPLPTVSELNFELFEAAMTGNVEAASSALKAGADINYTNVAGVSPLIVACGGMGPLTQIEQFIKAGASVNAEDSVGWTALIYVCSSGMLHLVTPLLKAGANINHSTKDKGWTPLTRAAYRGHVEVIKSLVEFGGLDVNCRTMGKSARDIAEEQGHQLVVEFLDKYDGASPA